VRMGCCRGFAIAMYFEFSDQLQFLARADGSDRPGDKEILTKEMQVSLLG
jgi:hypothetical protein